MLDYKSLSDDELYTLLETATAELRSRRDAALPPSIQREYTIVMRRTKRGEPRATRFTNVNGLVVQFPLAFDKTVGKSGNVLRRDIVLKHGDVVWKVAANGADDFVIAWPGTFDDHDPDYSSAFDGRTQAETIANIEAFVRGDRTLLLTELMDSIAFWQSTLLEYEEEAKTSQAWKKTADDCKSRIESFKAMLRWAQETNAT
jgi:hypothetical protein